MHRIRTYLRVVLLALILPVACDGGTGPDEDAENLMGPEGGTLTSGALTLEVPAGALDEPVEITATVISDVAAAAPVDFLVVDGTGFDLQPEGLTFNEPATLSIRVADAPLPAGVSPSELRLLHLDGSGVTLPSELDPDRDVVTGTVDHFSSFGVGLATRFSRVACPDLSFGATSGAALDTVALGQLPDTLEPPLLVRATVDGDTIASYGVVEVDDAGDAMMRVPIHPSADPAGGDVRLNVGDGTRACAGVDFTIDALPDAPGELEAVVDLLQAVLDAQAEGLNTTTAEILATPVDSLPRTMIPLLVAQSVIDDPANDHALRAIVDGTSSEAADAHVPLLDALLARTGLRAALEAVVTSTQAEVASSIPAPSTDAPGDLAWSVTAGLCTPDAVQANGAQFLDYCMDEAYAAAHEGVSAETLGDVSDALMYAGLIPGLGTATAVGGAVIWAVQMEKERNAALLPSLLTRMELEVSQTEFMEDEEGPGTWSAAVFATSQGYDLGSEFLNGALQGAGVVGIADKANITTTEIGHFKNWALSGPAAKVLLEGGTIDEFLLEAEDYGPVYVDEETWSKDWIEGTEFSNPTHGEFEPEEVGTTTLMVETQDGEFGGQQVAAQAELQVTQIQLTITPNDEFLQAGEPASYTVEVINAKHPEKVDVVERASLQGTVDAVTFNGGNQHTVQYTAPSAPDPSMPDLLTVEDTATTGARETATDRRLAIATIRFGELDIAPRDPCVDRGRTQTFTADTTGLGGKTIRWEIKTGEGTLSSTTGVSVDYTAPSAGEGTVTLRAYVESDSDTDDEVTFTWGVCSGLAVYRTAAASIGFPFTPGGTCGNPDLGESFEDNNAPESGLDPLVPPSESALLIDRTEYLWQELDQTGLFGDEVTDVGCVQATFRSLSGYDATYVGSPNADSVDIDVQTWAQSRCKDMGSELGTQCSSAAASVGTTVRFDLDIDHAINYDLSLQLTCDAYVIPMTPTPEISIITTRVAPDGSTLPPNTTTQPISMACGGGSTVTLDHTFEFAAPAAEDQIDDVMILVQFTNTSPGAILGYSEDPHEGYVQGFITLKQQ
ncbi:MAG: hypothetical protein R6U63_10460 [Longimicrobiales bacterium]